MKTDCGVYIKNCRACNIHKNQTHTPLKRYHARYPMERVHLDVLGLFTPSANGNKYALMMMLCGHIWMPNQSTH